MKKLIVPFALLASTAIYSQVGVNNTNPQATLEITSRTTDGSKPEGLIAPRLTGDQIRAGNTSYSSTQTGTIIYATSADSSPSGKTINITAPGYYYFDGSVWQKVLTGSTGDTTNDAWVNDNTNAMVGLATLSDGITTRTADQNMIVKDDGTIGIGTISPATKLDINGNLRIGSAESTSGSTNVSTLVRDNTTGEVKIAASSTGNSANITFVDYNLANVDKDWVASFNTNIPIDQYTVVVVGSTFNKQGLKSVGIGTYNPLNVSAEIIGSTWSLYADYNGGDTADGSNGTWTIHCMIVNNSITKKLPNINADLGGTNTGSAPFPPGL